MKHDTSDSLTPQEIELAKKQEQEEADVAHQVHLNARLVALRATVNRLVQENKELRERLEELSSEDSDM